MCVVCMHSVLHNSRLDLSRQCQRAMFVSLGTGFTGRKPGNPVKFSTEPDLTEAECHRLLEHFTPQHMKKNKTLQRLFIR